MARHFMGCLGSKEKNLVRKQTQLGDEVYGGFHMCIMRTITQSSCC